MLATLAAMAAFVLASVVVGQAACRLSGSARWSWLAPGVGLATLLVVASPLIRLPALVSTPLLLAGIVAAGVWVRRSLRPLLAPEVVGAMLLVLLAVLVPFIVNERFGLLGVSFNNDTRLHLWAAEYLRAEGEVPSFVIGGGYPLGPHALVAALSRATGIGVDEALNGLLMAVPVLTALTAMAALRELSAARRALVAAAVGLPYLLASYYAQAAFKETVQALLVLGFALALRELAIGGAQSPRAGVPLALLTAASVANYSFAGLAWPIGILGLWAIADVIQYRRRRGVRGTLRALGRLLPVAGVGLGVFALTSLPLVWQVIEFFRAVTLSPAGSGAITTENTGNLPQALSPLEAFGVYLSGDFRFPPAEPALTGALGALAVGVAAFGALWWLRRGDHVVPVAALVAGLVFTRLQGDESAYVAAKALVILSPLLILIGARALAAARPLRWRWRAAVFAVGAVFFAGMAASSFLTLRTAFVAPAEHERELRGLAPRLEGESVLFLGFDDFIGWRLFGATVTNPPIQSPIPFRLRPEKPFEYGDPLDFDSLVPADLDRYRFVITTAADFQSAAPASFRLVETTPSYRLWERRAATPPRRVLGEGDAPGAVLDCRRAAGRAVAGRGGRALVRGRAVVVRAPSSVAAGLTVPTDVALPPGRWNVSLQYTSTQELRVRSAGLDVSLPPNLDRPGPFWRVGIVTKSPPLGRQRLTFTPARRSRISSHAQLATLGLVAFTPVGQPVRVTRLASSCGRYVDGYLTRG